MNHKRFLGLLLPVALFSVAFTNCKSDSAGTADNADMQQQLDSLQMLNDQLQLERLTASIDSLPNFTETNTSNLSSDQRALLEKYNSARNKIEGLMAELRQLKSEHTSDKAEIKKRDEKIKALEAEIVSLKGIARDLLQQLTDLNAKYEAEVQKNDELTRQNDELVRTVDNTTAHNAQLQEKVAVAERLTLTSISLTPYNKKGKREKNVTKAKQLGAGFTITPNNTASPGMKDVYIRIKSPEGSLLPGNGTFTFDGASVPYTAKRTIEYANDELPVNVYWDVNTSLTPGEYTLEIFCDGNRLATRKFTLTK